MEKELSKLIEQHQGNKKSLKVDLDNAKAKESFYAELARTTEIKSESQSLKNERDYWRAIVVFLRQAIRQEQSIINALKEI